MTSTGTVPRHAALKLLDGVLGDGRMLPELTGPNGPLGSLDGAERARAQRLALDTLRGLDRADRLLGPYLRSRPAPSVHNMLRLGVVEICAEGAPAHAVVNAAVDIMRQGHHTAHAAGLVNAVLRKVSVADWEKFGPSRLPKWLRKPLIADYGKARVALIEAAHAASAPLDLTARNTDATGLAARVGGVILPTGSVRMTRAGQVSLLPGFTEGDWWVQDAAAALPARILAPRPGERVLDMCAAPGGKTMQMAAAGADVVALDISGTRMRRVRENLTRTGLRADCVVADVLDWQGGLFDAILLDAPCSATGTIRRHPDLPYAKDGSDFPALFALQEQMIDRAADMLKPGGRLVFCTCSLLPDEGEIQLEDALTRRADLVLDEDALQACPGLEENWFAKGGGLRLSPDMWPTRGGIDGFFIAALKKRK